MLYLTEAEINAILGDDICRVAEVMRKMMLCISNGDYSLGGRHNASHGLRMQYDAADGGQNIFVAMPGRLGKPFSVSGVKWYGPSRSDRAELPEFYFTLILNDMLTGEPLACMPANSITAFRTAAVNILAARTITRKKPRACAIVGPGRINTLVAKGLLASFPSIERCHVKGRGAASLDACVATLRQAFPQTEIIKAASLQEAVSNADIISLNTSFPGGNLTDLPLVRPQWARPGAVFLCSAFAYFPDAMLVNSAQFTCDLYSTYAAYEEELGYPVFNKLSMLGCKLADLVHEGKLERDRILELADLVAGKASLQEDDRPVLFASGGLSLEDLALGCEVYREALQRHMGIQLK